MTGYDVALAAEELAADLEVAGQLVEPFSDDLPRALKKMSPLPEPPERGAIWPPSTCGPETRLCGDAAWPPVRRCGSGSAMAPGPSKFSFQSM